MKRVEMLRAVERLPGSKFLCKCDCGETRVVSVGHFNSGTMKSCGCHARHGHAGIRSRTYVCYHNMIARCHKKSNKRYADYGGRGIVVCERWRESFQNFLSDMGECPPKLTIDRIDNDGNYEPDNCRWVSRSKNQCNRSCSITWIVNGKPYPSSTLAAKEHGVSSRTISAWCRGRWAAGKFYPKKEGCRAISRATGEVLGESKSS